LAIKIHYDKEDDIFTVYDNEHKPSETIEFSEFLNIDIDKNKADELIKYVYRKTKGRFVIIGVGGIFSAEDAYTKIRNGASLVQLVTGMIYEGPGIAKNINKGLIILLKKDGFREIKEVIGVDA